MRETRAWTGAVAVEGRTISGTAVPWNVPAKVVAPYGRVCEERWLPGSTTKSINERRDKIPHLWSHDDRTMPIGKPIGFTEDQFGLQYEARIFKGPQGDQLLEAIDSGLATGLSVGFVAVQDQWSNGERDRGIVEARIDEISSCNFATWDGAMVRDIRSATAFKFAPKNLRTIRGVAQRNRETRVWVEADAFPGSMEAISEALCDALNAYCETLPVSQLAMEWDMPYAVVMATYPDRVLVTINNLESADGDNDREMTFPYTVNADGIVELGEPVMVDLEVTVTPGDDAEDRSLWIVERELRLAERRYIAL